MKEHEIDSEWLEAFDKGYKKGSELDLGIEESNWNMNLERGKEGFNWLMNLPCVLDGRMVVEVRSCWPVLIIGMIAHQVETKQDVVDFIIEHLD